MTCKINRHILRWIEMVEQGEIRACKEQHALVAHIRRCFETEAIHTDDDQLERYLSLARYFPYEQLYPWEEFITALHMCTYWDDTGNPRWKDAFILLGRGAGKDGYIAFDAMCSISPYNEAEKYDVDICANNEEQAMRPMEDLIEALEDPKNEKKMKRHFYWTKTKVSSRKRKSTVRGRTNSPKGKDGLRSGKVIFNEVHQYEDYKNVKVFTTSLGKKKHPRRLYATSNGDVRGGVIDDMIDRCEGILFRGDADDGLLAFICRLNDKNQIHDEKNWEMANPSLPYKPELLEETRSEYKEYMRNPAALTDFMTKRMGIPEGAEESAITDWENIAATNQALPDLKGWTCTAGLDYATLSDMASVVLHFRNGEERYDLCHTWMCTRSKDISRIKAPIQKWADDGLLTFVDEAEINPFLIAGYIAEAARNYNIQAIRMDLYRYALVKEALAGVGIQEGDGRLKLVRPSDIMRTAPVILSAFANQNFCWGDNPLLRWAANNTKLVRAGKRAGTDTGNFVFGKIEGRSRKTDPFMALVHAMTAEEELPVNGITEIPDMIAAIY